MLGYIPFNEEAAQPFRVFFDTKPIEKTFENEEQR